jgi:cytochrome P450
MNGGSTVAQQNLAARDYFTDESILPDPFPYYEAVRANGPVWREPNHGAFLVTGYDEIGAVFRDPDAFSSCNAFAGPFPPLPGGPHGDDVSALIDQYRDVFAFSENFITFDPPEHTAHRGLTMRQLSPKRLEENEQFMWRAADEEIDRFVDRGTCEFVAEYAQPFSMLIIADLLGVPEADRGALRELIKSRGAPGPVGQPPTVNLLAYMEDFFTAYIEDRRHHPRDDVLTQMAHARFSDGSLPEVIDVVRVAAILFAGGQGTAARFLISAVRLLAEEPELQQQLRDDRSRIPDFVEEVLRFRSPTKVSFRMARRTCELGGVTVSAGSTLILLLSAGDRDPGQFECPAEFHLDRVNAREHVAFGRGHHSCPGAPLVRAEGRITLERVLDRLDDIRISEAHHGPADARRYDHTPSFILLGVDALHLEFRPRRESAPSGSAR